MKTWKILESFLGRSVLSEERMYRGQCKVRMKDLRDLFKEISEPDQKTKKAKSSDPQVKGSPNPDGGSITCSYSVNAKNWGRWSRSIDFAAIIASSGDDQNVGKAQGHLTVQKNYGGGKMNLAGKPRSDHEKFASSMDRYDVIMAAEVEGGNLQIPMTRGGEHGKSWHPPKTTDLKPYPAGANINFPPDGDPKTAPQIIVKKIAWSPAFGTPDEREKRLQDLLHGRQVAPMSRRAQPEVPEPSKDFVQMPGASPVARQGQSSHGAMRANSAGQRLPGSADDTFKMRLAAHDKQYTPQNKDRIDTPDVDRMFDPEDLPADRKPIRRK